MLSGHPAELPDGRVPVLISAHARDLVSAEAGGLLEYLDAHPVGVAAVARTLLATRPVRRHRAAVRARGTAELVDGLEALRRGAEHPLVCRSDRADTTRTAFVFPGQGSQWPGMGAALLEVAAYRAEAHRCAAAFQAAGHRSPLTYLSGADLPDADSVLVQAAQFTHAAALAATWRRFGVPPDVVVGHSLGELAAAYIAGVLDLDAAVRVVAARSLVTDIAPGRFGMVSLGVGPDAAADIIAGVAGWLELSVVNGPESVVVSGELAAVRDVLGRAAELGVFARELPVSYPAHTSALEPLRGRMLELTGESHFHSAPVEFIGSVFGGPAPGELTFGQYWYENLRRPVRFDRAAVAAAAGGVTAYIEMSAHPTLLTALADVVGDALLVGSTDRDRPTTETLSANIAAVAVADPRYRWRDVAPEAAGAPLRGFPNAPMHRTRLWAKLEPSPAGGRRPPPATTPDAPLTLVEEWLPITEFDFPATVSAVVVDYTGQSADLAAALTDALGITEPAADGDNAAELLVLVAPPAAGADVVVATAAFAEHGAAQIAPRPWPGCRRVWLVTRGAEQIGGDPPPRPGAAALAALHRSTGFGYPDQTFAHLDLPAAPSTADIGDAARALTLADTEIGVRDGRPLVRRLRRCPAVPAVRPLPDSVVITGGTGAIGLSFARYCAEHGARDITLLSRSGPAAVSAAQLAAAGVGTGARITVLACDVTDVEAVRAAAASRQPGPAGLVVHTASAAAVAGEEITADGVAAAFGAKVIGLRNLVDAWPLRPDARVLVCSSVLAAWGGSGHGLYAAANRMADALAGQLRAEGLDASSIRWGLWQTVAVVSGVERDRIARTGLTPMAPEAAIAAGLATAEPDPVILAADFDRLTVFFDSQGVPAPFETAEASAGQPAAPAPERALPEVVATELAAVLGLDEPAELDMHRGLVDLGLDSLLALDLRNRLNTATGRRVVLGALLSGITGAQLVAGLDDGCLVQSPARTTGKARIRHD